MRPILPERRAVRVPRDLPGSGWYELLPPSGPARELEGVGTADWVIVGAGFAGLAAARRLLQLRPRDKIVVLEAQRVGFGAAGRNSGFMIDLPHDLSTETYAGANEHDLRTIRLNRAGIAFAREAVEEFGLHDWFESSGKYHGAADAHGAGALRKFERHLDALGETYTALDAGEMKRLTGTDYYVGGTYTPGASLIQPAAFVRGLARGLAPKVDIRENSPVLRIESRGDHVVHTPKGRITTPRLILTVNGHIESFNFFSRRLMHVFTYASMTRQLTDAEARRLGGESAWRLIPADPMGSTLRRLRSNRIVVRNTFTYNPEMATSARQVAAIGRRHEASFRARFPMLSDMTMQYRWGGHLCLSLNAAPAFGEVAERAYAACCCNGLGTVRGTLGGKLIAELAANSSNPMIAEFAADGEPPRLYPEPLMTLGARAKLWWMERRAGRDL
jgi:glycine/D-amino acid oxidase-like deaminating enzyme